MVVLLLLMIDDLHSTAGVVTWVIWISFEVAGELSSAVDESLPLPFL